MRRTWIQLLAAFLLWALVFALCLGFVRGSLTLYFEVPPEAKGVTLRFEPEGIVQQAESGFSSDGNELSVRFTAVKRGSTQAILTWEGVGPDSFYDPETRMELHSLPFGVLTDSITWNFTGWGYLAACLSLFLLTAAGVFLVSARRERQKVFFS